MFSNVLFTKKFAVILGCDFSKGVTSLNISFLKRFFVILVELELRSFEWNAFKEPYVDGKTLAFSY